LKRDLQREGAIQTTHPQEWNEHDFNLLHRACALDTSLFHRQLGSDWTIIKERNWGGYETSRRYRFWLITTESELRGTEDLREKCFWCGRTKGEVSQLSDELIYWERYEIKTVICNNCMTATTRQMLTQRLDELYHASAGAINTDGLPKTAEDFINECQEAIEQVKARKHYACQDQFVETSDGW
jgi:hypothetical protein